MSKASVIVTKPVYEGILYTRDTGLTNMFDVEVVVKIMKASGYTESAKWVTKNRSQYAKGIFAGFDYND